jgi:hypothetical protein
MGLFKESERMKNVQYAIQVIANCDAAINTLNASKVTLLALQSAMAANTVDYTNEDRAEFNAELTRLVNLIEAIV